MQQKPAPSTALSFKPQKETYLPLPGSLRIG
nr:MAG TPA: hypothetical protein [Caudoviricetes sp.]